MITPEHTFVKQMFQEYTKMPDAHDSQIKQLEHCAHHYTHIYSKRKPVYGGGATMGPVDKSRLALEHEDKEKSAPEGSVWSSAAFVHNNGEKMPEIPTYQ